MTQIIPFNETSALPAYLQGDVSLADINKEVVRATGFPVLSIKGKQFTEVRDGVKKVLTKPDDPDEVAQYIGVVVLRANMNAKTFYAKKYEEGDSDGARPDCYSFDGVAPSAHAENPQSKKCAICPHNQWGARVSDNGEAKGKACTDNARLAISAPDKLDPLLLRVPPASLKPLRETLKVVAARKIPYNAVILRIGFDREAPSPKLTFKPVGLLNDAGYADVKELYDSELVRGIVGLDEDAFVASLPAPAEKPAVDTDELDAALAAKAATDKAKAKAEPAPEPEVQPEPPADPKPAKAAKAKAEPKAEPAKGENLLADLDALLGSSDD